MKAYITILVIILVGCKPAPLAPPIIRKLSGQVFIATQGGENVRIANADVELFTEEHLQQYLEERIAARRFVLASPQAKAVVEQMDGLQALLDKRHVAVANARSKVGDESRELADLNEALNEEIPSLKLMKLERWDPARYDNQGTRRDFIARRVETATRRKFALELSVRQWLRLLEEYENETGYGTFEIKGMLARMQETISQLETLLLAQVGPSNTAAITNAVHFEELEARARRVRVFPSPDFLSFPRLGSPSKQTKTDADGRFALETNETGKLALKVAGARTIQGKTERLTWFLWINPETERAIILSNDTLASEQHINNVLPFVLGAPIQVANP